MKITNQIIWEWKQYLINRDYSQNTLQNYLTDTRWFFDFISTGWDINTEEITLKWVEDWKTYLKDEKTPRNSIYYQVKPNLSPATIQTKLTALKSFLKFMNCMYDEGLDYRKIEQKRIKSDYIEYITEDEFKMLMSFIGSYEKYRINSLRMQLLCNIGYTSGLRLSEMLNLHVRDVLDWETRITGKWNKTRWVFFTNSSKELLEQYLEERNNPIPRTWIVEKPSDFVFISHNSGYDYWNPISKQTVCERMKKYSDWMELGKRITIHSLRHSYATRLLESWFNIREIQELMGHSDIQTTQTYLHVLKSNLKNKVDLVFA